MAEPSRPKHEPLGRIPSLGDPAVVLDVVVQVVFHTILVFAVYLHFAGHNQPGGGFIAGLAIGAGLALRMITGHDPIRTRFAVPYEVVLGVGAAIVTGTALVPLALGNSLLEHHTWEYDLPVLGTVKTTSALPFDTGILLVVVGVIGLLLQVMGSETDSTRPVPTSDDDGPVSAEDVPQ
jgi:multicomponent Na+:H+ antiporter subunit A